MKNNILILIGLVIIYFILKYFVPFGNLLLYTGFKKPNLAENIILFFSVLMIVVAIFWYQNLLTSLILISLSVGLYFLSKKTNYDALILQAIGVFSILYIIQDFNVGPSSDLAKFSFIFPTWLWMWIWLGIVFAMTGYSLKLILKK